MIRWNSISMALAAAGLVAGSAIVWVRTTRDVRRASALFNLLREERTAEDRERVMAELRSTAAGRRRLVNGLTDPIFAVRELCVEELQRWPDAWALGIEWRRILFHSTGDRPAEAAGKLGLILERAEDAGLKPARPIDSTTLMHTGKRDQTRATLRVIPLDYSASATKYHIDWVGVEAVLDNRFEQSFGRTLGVYHSSSEPCIPNAPCTIYVVPLHEDSTRWMVLDACGVRGSSHVGP